MISTPENYFLKKPRYLDNPHGWIPHIPFGFFLMEKIRPSMVAELGTYSGNSYFAFCQAAKDLKIQTKCFAIDTWMGDIHVGDYSEAIFERVREINQGEFETFSSLLRMPFDKALPRFKDGSIDLLHIDGTHTYEAIKHDFESWLPKMSGRGIILLHDTQVRRPDFGVWRFLEEIKESYPIMEFPFSEGLAMVGAGKKPDREILAFIKKTHDNPEIIQWFEKLGQNLLLSRENELFRKEVIKIRDKSARLNTDLLVKKKEIKRLRRRNSSLRNR